MDKKNIPQMTCRFKIRKDLNETYVGYFHTRGILIFNEIGAHIVNNVDGVKNLVDIANSVNKQFPKVKNPLNEVKNIVKQLQDAGFITQ